MDLENWYLWATLCMLITGVNSFILRVAVENFVDTTFLPLGLHIIVFLFSCLAFILFDGEFPDKHILPIAAFGILQGAFFSLSVFLRLKAIEYNAPSFIVFSLFQFKVIPVIILSFLFLNESSLFSDPIRLSGLVLGIISICLILEIRKFPHTRDNPIWFGIMLAVLGMLFSSLVSVLNKNTLDLYQGINIYFFMALVSGATILFSLLPVMKKYTINKDILMISKNGFGYGLIMGTMTFFAFFAFMNAVVKQGSLSQIAAINSLGVTIPILLASIFWGEKLTYRAEIAIFLAILALILIG